MAPGETIALENLDQLVKQHMAFLIRTVSHFTGKYVSVENDEEFSIALMAFTEAVTKYDENRENFLGFAKLVIESRLKTYFGKKERKHRKFLWKQCRKRGWILQRKKGRRTAACMKKLSGIGKSCCCLD